MNCVRPYFSAFAVIAECAIARFAYDQCSNSPTVLISMCQAQRLVDTDFGIYLGAPKCIRLSGRRKALICIRASDMRAADESQNTASEPGLLDQLRDRIRLKQHSIRTEVPYVHCDRWYILFRQQRHPRDMRATEVAAFLAHLVVGGSFAAATQKQALSVRLFLYRELMGVDLPWLDDVLRAKRRQRMSVLLSRAEVPRVLERMEGVHALLARLLCGTGRRLMEVIRWRVKDVDCERGEILIRDGKAAQDRVTMLPEAVVADLRAYCVKAATTCARYRNSSGVPTCRRGDDDDLHAGTQQGRARGAQAARRFGRASCCVLDETFGKPLLPSVIARRRSRRGNAEVWLCAWSPCQCAGK
jgi:integrase